MGQKNSHAVRHLGIVMDGNRRWARSHGLPTLFGHKKGVETLKKAGVWCIERGIEFLTVWVFSTENWDRPKQEVTYLMKLFIQVATKEVGDLMKMGVRLNVIGRIKELPKEVREVLESAIEKTKHNTKVTLNLALNYGGRAEIIDAIRSLVSAHVNPANISEEMVTKFMYAPALPSPDLIIRTGGVERTSGFLMWETPYSEWYFSDKKWPEFNEAELDNALAYFGKCQRNFGR